MDTKRGYSIQKDRLLQRLARIKGQVDGIAGMVEEDRYCIDVVTQIGAVQGALDKISMTTLATACSARVRHLGIQTLRPTS
jgi:DNA-binding FrmR family transcriptional regulator